MQNKKFFIQRLAGSRSFKNNLIFIMFVFFFTISFSIILKRHFEPKIPSSSLQNRIEIRKFTLKTEKNTKLFSVNTLHTLNFISDILENGGPLSDLKTFLQNTPNPWASSFFISLVPLGDIIKYSDLELFFVSKYCDVKIYSQAKETHTGEFFSFLEKTGNFVFSEEKKNILKALQNYNIENGLVYFDKLPNNDKLLLSSWEKMARDRLMFEIICKNILITFSKENNL